MSKILPWILCFLLVMSLAACSDTAAALPSATETTTESIPEQETAGTEAACQHEYREEIQKEAGYGVKGVKVKHCTLCGDIDYITIPALPAILELKVTGKTTSLQDDTGLVYFEIEIKNISDKKIESVSGVLSVMPSDRILELMCNFEDLSLEAHGTATIHSYGYHFAFASSEGNVERKVYDTALEDLMIWFVPTEVTVAE